MYQVRYVQADDKEFWYSLDKHLSEKEFENKIQNRQGYIIFDGAQAIGLLRYNLFWDNTPFCTLLYVKDAFQKRGAGRQLMEYWENDMRSQGFGMVMTSTQVDEDAQHFIGNWDMSIAVGL